MVSKEKLVIFTVYTVVVVLCSLVLGSFLGEQSANYRFKQRRYSLPASTSRDCGWYHGPVTWHQDPSGYWHYMPVGP